MFKGLCTKTNRIIIFSIVFLIFSTGIMVESHANMGEYYTLNEDTSNKNQEKSSLIQYQIKYDREENYREKIVNTLRATSIIPEEYDLRDYIDIEVKNQENLSTCWLHSINSAIETNLAKQGITAKFDEMYADEKTIQLYNKTSKEGGNNYISLGFYTSGAGPKNLSDNNIEYEVEDYVAFPSINKKKVENDTEYYDSQGTKLTITQVNEIRNSIKSHIMNYGAVTAVTYSKGEEYYSNQNNPETSKAYYCDSNSVIQDHAITIIGWDDDYDVANFNSNHKPSNPGAYIVLNSWGKSKFDNGYIYISYEDVLIEQLVFGVKEANKIDHEKMYQHDELGVNYIMMLPKTISDCFYAANVFTRDSQNPELLTEISIANLEKGSYEIYVNSEDGYLNSSKLKNIKTTSELEPGYNTIELDEPIVLKGNKFAIAVKCIRTRGI